ncbi:hypothetical protein JY651_39030 [Pyxidicoccus parkwayensis]|uniref:Uncharacterized protein n=1 Tax=Pyxidicoccus parkwayensis TaxID=2813578 RepID=A0ABX7NRW6_9BACT|nr:hypothetical protein [Pyxidicoccus parkwaysis]QSQ21141.1 hypothetical protein JY651_39030 [Pyxidicoccus parkwaysis]
MSEPTTPRRPRVLFIRDLVPVRRPDATPRDAQVTTMMVGEEKDTGSEQ